MAINKKQLNAKVKKFNYRISKGLNNYQKSTLRWVGVEPDKIYTRFMSEDEREYLNAKLDEVLAIEFLTPSGWNKFRKSMMEKTGVDKSTFDFFVDNMTTEGIAWMKSSNMSMGYNPITDNFMVEMANAQRGTAIDLNGRTLNVQMMNEMMKADKHTDPLAQYMTPDGQIDEAKFAELERRRMWGK